MNLSNAHQCRLRRRTFHTCFRHTSAARGPSRALEKRACLLAVLPACGASTAARIKTVLQGRAPWHGPVACVPGQVHSSMVRPPYLSTARVPRPPVSCPPSQRQHPLARWSERLDLIWLLIAAKCGLLKVTSKTKKTKNKSHKFHGRSTHRTRCSKAQDIWP